jgi:hypothetical protein
MPDAYEQDRYGWSTFQLHELMRVFGPKIVAFSPMYFRDGIIRVIPK